MSIDHTKLQVEYDRLIRWLSAAQGNSATLQVISVGVVEKHIYQILNGKGDIKQAIKAVDHARVAFGSA